MRAGTARLCVGKDACSGFEIQHVSSMRKSEMVLAAWALEDAVSVSAAPRVLWPDCQRIPAPHE
jgi:hypothetical protein